MYISLFNEINYLSCEKNEFFQNNISLNLQLKFGFQVRACMCIVDYCYVLDSASEMIQITKVHKRIDRHRQASQANDNN